MQLKLSIKYFTQELCRFGYCEKMTEQTTLNQNVSENDVNLWNSANGWKNLDRRPWPETWISIEMDSACRNQQGN